MAVAAGGPPSLSSPLACATRLGMKECIALAYLRSNNYEEPVGSDAVPNDSSCLVPLGVEGNNPSNHSVN